MLRPEETHWCCWREVNGSTVTQFNDGRIVVDTTQLEHGRIYGGHYHYRSYHDVATNKEPLFVRRFD